MNEFLTVSICTLLSVAGAFLLVETIFYLCKIIFGVMIALKVANHQRTARRVTKAPNRS